MLKLHNKSKTVDTFAEQFINTLLDISTQCLLFSHQFSPLGNERLKNNFKAMIMRTVSVSKDVTISLQSGIHSHSSHHLLANIMAIEDPHYSLVSD